MKNPFNMQDERKKASIDFKDNTFELLSDYKDFMNAPSNSFVVNYLLELFLDLTPEIKKNLAIFCHDQAEKLDKRENLGAFESIKIKETKSQYLDLMYFFNDGKDFEPEEHNLMQRIDTEKGYIIAPKDWILIDYHTSEYCDYVGVIEVRNGAKYNAPHFIFFSAIPIYEITDFDRKLIIHRCISKYPEFEDIINLEIEPIYGSNNKMINEKEWLDAPEIGFFQMYEYGTTNSYPAGSMFVKNK